MLWKPLGCPSGTLQASPTGPPATDIFKRIDERMAENRVSLEQLKRNEDKCRKKVDDIHEQLEDFNKAVQNLRACFDYVRAKIAAEHSSRLAVDDRINEIVRSFI
jgi:predicted  nucleic acid-binding Zn-ribbon protein